MKDQLPSSLCYQSLFLKFHSCRKQKKKNLIFAFNTLKNPGKDFKLNIYNNFAEIIQDL